MAFLLPVNSLLHFLVQKKKFQKFQNEAFFIRDKNCHLKFCLRLMEPTCSIVALGIFCISWTQGLCKCLSSLLRTTLIVQNQDGPQFRMLLWQCGLAEAVVHAISKCSSDARPWLYRNIVLTGGSANFRNFRERMEKEIRLLAPEKYDVSKVQD